MKDDKTFAGHMCPLVVSDFTTASVPPRLIRGVAALKCWAHDHPIFEGEVSRSVMSPLCGRHAAA